MSFTDQKPRIATKEECEAHWGGDKKGKRFRCYLCGHKFIVGDYWRWVYDNSSGGYGNFSVCEKCDGDDALKKWKKSNEEAKEKYWWFHGE